MRSDILEPLDELAGALCNVLADPAFDSFHKEDQVGFGKYLSFLRNGLSYHSESEILEALRDVHQRRPYLFTQVFAACRRLGSIRDFRDMREKSLAYRIAAAPIHLPKMFGTLALLKLSTREAQWSVYYTVLGLECLVLMLILGWMSPQLVAGAFFWCALAELVERDLDTEEALSNNSLFDMLRLAGVMEELLEKCDERCIEFGKLYGASERLSYENPLDLPPHEMDLAEPAPDRNERVSHDDDRT